MEYSAKSQSCAATNQPGEYGQEQEMEGVRHISPHQMGQQRQKERARLQEGMFPEAAALRCGLHPGEVTENRYFSHQRAEHRKQPSPAIGLTF